MGPVIRWWQMRTFQATAKNKWLKIHKHLHQCLCLDAHSIAQVRKSHKADSGKKSLGNVALTKNAALRWRDHLGLVSRWLVDVFPKVFDSLCAVTDFSLKMCFTWLSRLDSAATHTVLCSDFVTPAKRENRSKIQKYQLLWSQIVIVFVLFCF